MISKHEQKKMISKPEQIDDIAICESFDTKIFPENTREKKCHRSNKKFYNVNFKREDATIIWNVQYDSGKVVIIHYKMDMCVVPVWEE